MTRTVPEAFTEFVQSVEPRLRIALVARDGPERGREATAEALAYAWEHWDRVGGMEHPVGYLYRVGQSKSRSRRRPPVVADRPESHEPWVEPGLPTALQSLSNRQRMAVVLVHAYGWSQREAAEVMQVSPDTVRTHLERGLSKLRSALEVAYD
mgnify:CR=1 FL=1